MASSIDIANFALTRLGANRITSFSDGTKEAIATNLFYETTRKFCLESYGWSFAIKRTTLAASSTPPAFGYIYAYTLPSDLLTVYQVGEYFPPYSYSTIQNKEQQLYVIENNEILTNLEAPLKLFYVFNNTDTSRYSNAFVRWLSLMLAHECCEEITQSNTKKNLLLQEADFVYKQAVAFDRMQKAPETIEDNSFIDSRLNWHGGI